MLILRKDAHTVVLNGEHPFCLSYVSRYINLNGNTSTEFDRVTDQMLKKLNDLMIVSVNNRQLADHNNSLIVFNQRMQIGNSLFTGPKCIDALQILLLFIDE